MSEEFPAPEPTEGHPADRPEVDEHSPEPGTAVAILDPRVAEAGSEPAWEEVDAVPVDDDPGAAGGAGYGGGYRVFEGGVDEPPRERSRPAAEDQTSAEQEQRIRPGSFSIPTRPPLTPAERLNKIFGPLYASQNELAEPPEEPPDTRTALLGQSHSMALRYPRLTDKAEFGETLARLREHLQDIAADPRGSDPRLYVSESDVEFLFRELLPYSRRPSSLRKGATPITHEETTPHWLPRWRKKTDNIVRDAEGNPVVGYRVGYLNVAQFEAPVFFCSDGTLRMLIKHNYRQTTKTGPIIRIGDKRRTFSGYCRLPDPALIYPVRTRGTKTAVSYNHGQTNNLETELTKLTGRPFPL